jgi:hypothetical protein
MMNLADDRVVDDLLRKLVSDRAPLSVERRLRSQLADFRSRLSTPEPAVAIHARGRARPAAWWRLGAACAVLVVLAAVAGLVLRPQTSFAEVATAVLEQPWVHARTVHADQSVSEAWFSPGKDISASRWRGSAKYEDHRLQVYYSYNPVEQVLYRSPVVERTSPASQFESMAEGLKILLQGNGSLDKPLAHLGFLGSEGDKMKVLDQHMEKITEQDHTWLDYRIKVKYSELTEPVRMLFRVDASTKLPRMSRTEGRQDGKPTMLEIQFDYPGTGPADIYDLGVPKTTKLVDRVPAGDLKRIAETLRAGRERMDNYRAVFVEQDEGFNQAWWTNYPEVFYRKGDRFRRDFVVGEQSNRGKLQRPAADVDLRKWWFERARLFRFSPIYVQLGPTSYTCTRQTVIDPDGSQHLEIASVQKYVYNLMPGETFPADYVMRPEFACRPPIGLGDEHQEPSLDMHPAEGPAGCILLNVRHTTKDGRVNEKGIGLADVNRFWLDPRRDYIVMQWEMVMRDGTGKETIASNHTVEETARSPQGVWYATKIRLKNAVRAENGKQFDQIYHIYVDFDAELPDSLFEPPTPRRIK